MKDEEPQTQITRRNILLALIVMWASFVVGQVVLHFILDEAWIRAIDRCFWMGAFVISMIGTLRLWRE